MNPRHVPLAGRVPGIEPPTATPHTAPVEETADRAAPDGGHPRHVWVVNTPEAPGRWPGVLLGWQRRADGGWVGRVTMAAVGREGMVTMTLWVRAEHLRPTETA